ncbi:HAD family hydrolase [Salinicoccus halitifaciens]|uniref:HAD superfamily hydrolase (TIGR01509 family) n=1 Tax=Salinicoccus halitifaciens TaxID=1073415 RepID=A0ABV2E804_9STAP|nr:HAD family hydrolase [Salinicoccus halitifaciens]MCD2136755.1 HAD family hydrolase [Salinicoccus halitifaciens]
MKYQNIRAVIFDFDGTLADTLPLCYHAFQTVFKTFDGKDFTDEEIRSLFGPAEPAIIEEHLVSDEKESAIDLYFKTYTENHDDFVIRNDKMHTLITGLKEKGIKLGIVTGKSRKSLEISLKRLGMENFFDCKISGDDVDRPKPDPEGIFTVLNKLNLRKDEVVFLGDSDADIGAGMSAGVWTIGVQWLPNVQTSHFSTEPDEVYKEIDDFMRKFSL